MMLANKATVEALGLPVTHEYLAKLKRLRAAIVANQRAEADSATQKFSKYFADPVGFITEGLGEFLWSKQKEVCLSVLNNRRTAVPSCHEAGKSFIASRIIGWWVSRDKPGEAFVVTSAPSFHQVRAILWRELNRAHKAGHLPGRMNQTEWWISDELVAFGRKPADMDTTGFQGIHARRVLVVLDEAGGIPKQLMDAVDSLIANDDSAMLAIGNPDDPTAEFATICKPGSGWNVIPIDAFETPNFTKEPVPDKLRSLLIGHVWVEEKRKKWGEGSPMWQAKVRGQFPEQSDDGLIPLGSIRGAVTRDLPKGTPIELGVDIARFGTDHTVIRARWGAHTRRIAKLFQRDLMTVCGAVIDAVRSTPGCTAVKLDDAGLGGGVTDRLNEIKDGTEAGSEALKGVDIVPINVGEGPATDVADERYLNLRAELNWALRDRFMTGDIDIEDDEDLQNQASQMKYKMTSRGEIQIEKKDEMKKRTGGVSPDDWDSLVLTFARPSFPGSGFLDMVAEDRAAAAHQAERTIQ